MATPPATRTSHPLRYVAGIVLVVAWGWLARRGDLRPHPELWIPVAAATAAFAWVAVRRRFDRRALWTFAILFR
ncbi:MAG: hypothetical protein OER88_11995, partial [Planctomycetota bacterium]|nr:hypothetical protein [Planctomycetota bacterium]